MVALNTAAGQHAARSAFGLPVFIYFFIKQLRQSELQWTENELPTDWK
jgi:hypothetical protein